MSVPDGIVIGPDELPRCAWAGSTPDYLEYHDHEWGVPVHGESALYERVTLEAFQSGLAWITILRKRPAFRAAFADFDADTVASYDEGDVERLMSDASIVRNRRKIDAAVTNARAVVRLREDGGLDHVVWSHRPASHRPPRTLADAATTTPESVALARTLKKAGFAHVGPTTMYAAMQACGLVDDHLAGCFRSTGARS
ncbi:DNA-3-methyladenine glycosylase I [Luteipulveratus sp. YIM 133132]|uniref:DNA-3-methyladenine glycosylase I n=1 Tax=Luteipulveratus flavus TaxID=3031728 RepID=A0ABT6C7T4_9MICO|nr:MULTISPECIES: DNA-3-methyladenine glycosylase I [unclassified Luteipulveratus]MDE9365803.1 DNA-3-methyladenine glycosylase I [Luteipulveratus sp. YIM 133132]MDF8264993.1 DNA-3-methyladenine glycosylase I [Luteipulveratus sp. YIM 133296]